MTQRATQETGVQAWPKYRAALLSLAVGIAWRGLPAASVRAATPLEGARSAASTAGDAHPAALPSVLILPPRFVPRRMNDTDSADCAPFGAEAAAAETACDRLAQDIAAGGLARVVDRTQLDRILEERKLQTDPARPMLSYDAMLRLEADTTRLAPETTLSLIDLSTGNIIAQRAFAWPPSEATAKPMLDFCRDALKVVGQPAAGKLRVRALWSADATGNERIRPLGKRLVEVFDEALQRSDRVLLVHHLEATTTKEESLLLLMGLSRLPDWRQFTPQANATIELRLVEGDGSGKTFSDTPLEIGVRLRKGAAYQGDWVTTTGPVRDFDATISRAWQKLAQSLGEVRPETATALIDEMELRRKQAEAEVHTAREIWVGTGASPAVMARVEAAAKLDPTCREAALAHIQLLFEMNCAMETPGDVPQRTMFEASRYLERFPQDAELCNALCEGACPVSIALPCFAFTTSIATWNSCRRRPRTVKSS